MSAYIPESNSVVAFQSDATKLKVSASVIGLTPVAVTNTPSISGTVNIAGIPSISGTVLVGNNLVASVSGTVGASVIGLPYVAVAGSVATVGTAVANQSVSGTVDIGVQSGSVAAIQGTSPWIIKGSVQATITPPDNQSVSGTVDIGVIPGSVVAFQSKPSSMLVGASIIGLTPVSISNPNSSVQILGTPSISGAVTVVGNPSISGTVNAIQSGTWGASVTGTVFVAGSVAAISTAAANQSVSGTVHIDNFSSVIAYQLAGSIMTVGGTVTTSGGNSSVQLLQGVAAIGSVATLQGTNPWLIGNSSVQLVGPTSPPGSVSGTVDIGVSPGSVVVFSSKPSSILVGASVYGNIGAYQIGTWGSSVQVINNITIANPNSSIQILGPGSASIATYNAGGTASVQLLTTSASIATLVNNQLTGVSSVQLMAGVNNAGSITAIQGTTPWIITSNGNSVISADSYAEDSAHVTANRGTFIMGVRNDTMGSVTSADNDYTPFTVGPAGENVVANAPITKWVSGVTSVMYGPSVAVMTAGGASTYTYITGIHVINESANASRVTFTQGAISVASTLYYAIAPAGGGTNMNFINPIKTLDNRGICASISGISSVYVMLTGFLSKT